MSALPTGTVTFPFTDIEGSTRLLHALGVEFHSVQDRHGEIVRATIDANDGHVVRTEGDSFFATFRSPIEAVRAAITAQRGLAGIAWPAGSDLRVRMGLHTGSGVQALAIREQKGRHLIDTLVDGLATTDVLLVLDNFEHVLSGAWVAERLLGAAPRLRILATSRAPLRLYGEQELPVPPLALPDLGDAHELMVLSRYEAIALFVERARAASPGFVLSNGNARLVADICARLDGLPLAIELAASRIKVLTPQAIFSRLGGLDRLTTRNLPPRQRTLRATISWRYGLLAEPEQRLFARLSVFRGGASLEALEAVGNPEGDLGVDTLDGLTSLIDNSLVGKTEMRNGDPRFGMLETIREFAGELLAADGDEAATRRRHADYFLALAHAGEPHLTADDQAPWLNRFEHEHDNLQAAFQWALEVGQPERGADAATAMWRFWQQRGYLESAQGRHERAVRLFEAGRELQRKLEGALPLAAGELAGADVLGIARQTIGDEAVEEAMAEGRSMTRAEAVAYAIEPG